MGPRGIGARFIFDENNDRDGDEVNHEWFIRFIPGIKILFRMLMMSAFSNKSAAVITANI